ncbi:MAG: type IV toxin-antitoxin system AbiEi family antitoxin domain-containing protein [Candidatus Omnitrophica bacterium]|nr:type IV toxin-antitoxin system AbiEi family antitoxin domain-containing protein [Candidatus Omnitrophota bacterium]
MLKQLLQFSDQIPLFYPYLKDKGYSPQLLYRYVQSGWLEKLAKGVYKRKGRGLDPFLIVKAMQEQLKWPVFIGAQSVMALQNKAHYVKFKNTYQLFLSSPIRLNDWFKSLSEFHFIKEKIFKHPLNGLTTWGDGIKVSTLERAFIEMAFLVPSKASYEELINNLELTPNLRAGLLQSLLEDCSSFKAKRLFLHAAQKAGHKWFNHLNVARISLGKGARQITKGGIYDKKYKVSVPKIKTDV